MDQPFETEQAARPRRNFVEDWEREAMGRRLFPNAYWRPVMSLFNAGASPVREAILGYFSQMGVPEGLNKNATPEQRKQFMLWAEKKWPKLCASIEGWPKDEQGRASLASKLTAPAPGAIVSTGDIATSIERQRFPAGAPYVEVAIICFCGAQKRLKAATGQYTCSCGAKWTIKDLLIDAQPANVQTFTFGRDPEGEGPLSVATSIRSSGSILPAGTAYEGTSVRGGLKHVIAQPVVDRPGVVRLGQYVNEDEDVGLPRDFTGLGGLRVGPIGGHRREPYGAEEGHDPGDTQDLGDVPEADPNSPKEDLF